MMAYIKLSARFPIKIVENIRKAFYSTSQNMQSNNNEEEKGSDFPKQTKGKILNLVNTAASTFELDPNPSNSVSRQVCTEVSDYLYRSKGTFTLKIPLLQSSTLR